PVRAVGAVLAPGRRAGGPLGDGAGAPAALDANRCDQVEPEEREVGEVVLRQRLAAEVGVDEPEAAEAAARRTEAADVGKDELGRVPDDDVLDLTAAIDEDADLTRDLGRALAEKRRELGPDDVRRNHAPAIDALQHSPGIGREPSGIAAHFLHTEFPIILSRRCRGCARSWSMASRKRSASSWRSSRGRS